MNLRLFSIFISLIRTWWIGQFATLKSNPKNSALKIILPILIPLAPVKKILKYGIRILVAYLSLNGWVVQINISPHEKIGWHQALLQLIWTFWHSGHWTEVTWVNWSDIDHLSRLVYKPSSCSIDFNLIFLDSFCLNRIVQERLDIIESY